jgi:hypothetical protein
MARTLYGDRWRPFLGDEAITILGGLIWVPTSWIRRRQAGQGAAQIGTAKFTSVGLISNNQVAGHFTYVRNDVNGFGTNFTEFDSAGNGTMYMIVRVTKLLSNESDVAQVEIQRAARNL